VRLPLDRNVVPSIWHHLRKRRHGGIVRTTSVNDRGQCTWRDERKWRQKANVPFHRHSEWQDLNLVKVWLQSSPVARTFDLLELNGEDFRGSNTDRLLFHPGRRDTVICCRTTANIAKHDWV
jgi:hypothetical protein